MNVSDNNQIKEQISALMDGECQNQDMNEALASLRAQTHKNDWEIYHQIGDILNSNELSIKLSNDFNSRFSARLGECVISKADQFAPAQKISKHWNSKVAYALAAMLALVTVMVPQFAGHDGAEVSAPYFAGQFMSANYVNQSKSSLNTVVSIKNSDSSSSESQTTMLRDPLIDRYLAAHQRYSNSVYSAVEYETSPIIQEAGK